jgi:hypothetical protein
VAQPEYPLLQLVEDYYGYLRHASQADVDEILSSLSAHRREQVKSWLREGEPWTIGFGYPTAVQAAPVVNLVVHDDLDHERGSFVGDVVIDQTTLDPDTGEATAYATTFGMLQRGEFTFLMIAPGAEAATWMYHIVKAAVLRDRSGPRGGSLEAQGITEMDLRGGDLSPDERWLPDHVFGRTLTVSLSFPVTWTETPEGTEFVTRVEAGEQTTYAYPDPYPTP